jgi:hypothetical protein
MLKRNAESNATKWDAKRIQHVIDIGQAGYSGMPGT